jgi:deoxyribonuclease IV
MLLGAHVSIAGGVSKAVENGIRIGCDAIQLFTKNQRQWAAKPYPPEEVEAFRSAYAASGLQGLVAHATYLINTASPDDTAWRRSTAALLDEAQRCDALGVTDLIFHPGAHMGSGVQAGLKRTAEAMQEVIARTEGGRVRLSPETMAGQGSTVGDKFEQLAELLDLVGDAKRTSVCVDTCHVFAAGYDLGTPDGYEETFRMLDRTIGLRRVTSFQINDSKSPLGSRVDRHEDIGVGHIGTSGFGQLMNDARFERVPMLLETPGTDEGYMENLKVLRGLIGKSPPKPKRPTLSSYSRKI